MAPVSPLPQQQGAMVPLQQIEEHRRAVEDLMARLMKDGVHYGTIPGCGNKPALLQPGAQLLAQLFNCSPTFEVTKTSHDNGHRTFDVVCRMVHRGTGVVVGEGVGIGTTLEAKYRYRAAERKCPACGKAAIIKGKEEYGGGWVCFKKKDGCGAKYDDADPKITGQSAGKVEHDNPADYYNTVQKMACKRAYVHAALNITAASDIFTQDMEEHEETPARRERFEPAQMRQAQQPPATATNGQAKAAPKPAASTAKPADMPAEGVRCWGVAKVEVHKQGTNERTGRQYVIHKITSKEGPVFFTFSSTDAAVATECERHGWQVEIEWTTNQFQQLTAQSVAAVEPRKDGTAVVGTAAPVIDVDDIPF